MRTQQLIKVNLMRIFAIFYQNCLRTQLFRRNFASSKGNKTLETIKKQRLFRLVEIIDLGLAELLR